MGTEPTLSGSSGDRGTLVVLCNTAPENGTELATELVKRRLAACVNVIPRIESVYAWKGELCRDGEATLLIKTTRGRLEALKDAIGELHPYDLPEILVIEVDQESSSREYLEWVAGECGADRLE